MLPEIVIPILATVAWYLAGMAELTRAIWSRYPARLDRWVQCPACFGTWAGAGVALALNLPVLGFPGRSLPALVLAGLWCTFWVPLCAWALYRALSTFHQES